MKKNTTILSLTLFCVLTLFTLNTNANPENSKPDFFIENKNIEYQSSNIEFTTIGKVTGFTLDGNQLTIDVSIRAIDNPDIPAIYGNPNRDIKISMVFENGNYYREMEEDMVKGEFRETENGKILGFSGSMSGLDFVAPK